jgi:hypothetical protein
MNLIHVQGGLQYPHFARQIRFVQIHRRKVVVSGAVAIVIKP